MERMINMNELQVFKNSEFGELRVIELDGKVYFPATACAKILGYSNPHDAVKRHCKREECVKHEGVSQTTNQHGKTTQQVVSTNYISEGNLYRLIVSSKLPSAEKFEHWIFDEVLSSIRKTGGYGNISNLLVQQIATLTTATTSILNRLERIENNYGDENELMEHSIRRKRPISIISRLDTNTKREVEAMLCSEIYTYSEIASHLRDLGISISTASICRYAKSMD